MGAKDENDDEIELLRVEVAALRENVTSLMNDLRVARSHIDLTMRGQMRCRACNCRRIAYAPKVLDRSETVDHPLAVFRKQRLFSDMNYGVLELYICTRCGLVEWWVADPADLQPNGEVLQIIDGDVSGPKDPYR
jgi:hypothetical protein